MASTPYPKSFVHEDYTVGWVCALYSELTAATTMLEQTHPELPKPGDDTNAYTLGSISGHNIVIACLPTGKIGNNSAAAVAVQMIRTFPSIRFGLMVGIGGGIPPKVRLGDVVVSTPTGGYPGVVQYDLGKAKEGGRFERTGALNTPPKSLLTAITKLRAEHERTGSRVPEYLNDLGQRYPKMAPTYLRTDSLKDVLFKSSYSHVVKSPTTNEEDGDEDEDEEDGCLHCDKTMVVNRKTRTHNDLVVHYGLVASGNQVVKNAAVRNEIKKSLEDQALCVEMEAAGLVDNFPCMVIRGICDYADSHKNDRWQSHAAAVAAAFARELLSYVQPSDVKGESTVKDILDQS
jgi:nucleoside phosphorylase